MSKTALDDGILALLASAVYAAWTGCVLSPGASVINRRASWFREVSPGDLVMETSSIYRREDDRDRFGHLVSITDEPYLSDEEWQELRENYPPEYQHQPPTKRIWTILTFDGRQVRWENSDFIRVPQMMPGESTRGEFWDL